MVDHAVVASEGGNSPPERLTAILRKPALYWLGFLLVVVPTALATYLYQPFPGSQDLDSVRFAWHLERFRVASEPIGGLLLVLGLVGLLTSPSRLWRKLLGVAGVLMAAGLLWFSHVKMSPAAWFRPAESVRFAHGTTPELPASTLVMGLVVEGEARAYPIRLLAYHHRVLDDVGGVPVFVTYCTMCRTGKVLRPEAAGRKLTFELVGAYRYNSVYEDRETGSWWYQANGRAVAGPLEGEVLPELPVDQMTLGEWLALHPESLVLQPDPAFAEGYQMFGFANFDSKREDPARGEPWQWVVGVISGGKARSYPWSVLARDRILEDQLGELPLVLHLRSDGISFRVWDRRLGDRVLRFTLDPTDDVLVDQASGTRFAFDGIGRGGELDGKWLQQVPATLEFRHSFAVFSGGEPWQPAQAR